MIGSRLIHALKSQTPSKIQRLFPYASFRSFSSSPEHREVVIIGSGPAGLTAALYTSRANLNPLMLTGYEEGGQLMTTTEVENFPGFVDGLLGPELIENMKQQAARFGTEYRSEEVSSVIFSPSSSISQPHQITTNKQSYTANAVIISTGAVAKYLNLLNEQRLIGQGVSACATCDGFFFKEKVVVVVGGGDTAMEEATFLTKFASKVYIVHRRDSLRASKIMGQRAADNPKIEFIWNTTLSDVLGDKKVSGVRLQSTVDGTERDLECDGLFLAIGHKPNTEVFDGQVECDDHGYVVVEPGTVNTSQPGVFACGDVQDLRYKQAITAAGTGCMAAMDAEKYLEDLHSQSAMK